jgi:dipeptidyl aminopeptidase/acylaminoacyl peptidase
VFPPFACSNFPAYGPECQFGIVIVDVATGTITRLGANAVFEPAFSPNGKEIAFVNPGGTYGIDPGVRLNHLPIGVDVMSATGGDVRRVTPDIDHPQTDAGPNWSPDGKDIVFSSNMPPADDGNPNLWTVGALGGRPKLATVSPSDLTAPTWVQPLTTCTVPKLKGQTLVEATRLARLAGCVLGTVTGPTKNRNKLHVVSQNPVANKNVPVGTKVDVQIG